MKYTLKPTTQFKRDLKKAQKQNKNLDLLNKVLQQLADGIPLPEKNRDHALTGNYAGCRECHIQPIGFSFMKLQKIHSFCISPEPAAIVNYLNDKQTRTPPESFILIMCVFLSHFHLHKFYLIRKSSLFQMNLIPEIPQHPTIKVGDLHRRTCHHQRRAARESSRWESIQFPFSAIEVRHATSMPQFMLQHMQTRSIQHIQIGII